MKKLNLKKLELAKETLRSLELRNAAGQLQYQGRGFDPNFTMNMDCTYSTIA